MRVGDEVEEVAAGTMILVPPGTDHSHPQRRGGKTDLRLSHLAALRDAGRKHQLDGPGGAIDRRNE